MAENEEVLETAESDGDAARGGTPEAPSPESRSGRRRPPENERGGILMKYNRQSEIIALINENEIEKQDELSERLREKGYMVTQATISRDIRELGLIKVTGSTGKYKYALPRREHLAPSRDLRDLGREDRLEAGELGRGGGLRLARRGRGLPGLPVVGGR